MPTTFTSAAPPPQHLSRWVVCVPVPAPAPPALALGARRHLLTRARFFPRRKLLPLRGPLVAAVGRLAAAILRRQAGRRKDVHVVDDVAAHPRQHLLEELVPLELVLSQGVPLTVPVATTPQPQTSTLAHTGTTAHTRTTRWRRRGHCQSRLQAWRAAGVPLASRTLAAFLTVVYLSGHVNTAQHACVMVACM